MNERLETFSDGIFAIAMTLLILEIKVPPVSSIHSFLGLKNELLAQWPSWFAFLLSFIAMFIAWINHHHFMAQLNRTKSSNAFLYIHGLFFLTICVYPFTTALLAEYLNTEFLTFPVFIYCFMNTVHAGSWVLIHHFALHPINLTKNEKAAKHISKTGKSIIYTVIFNLGMCIMAFWFPMTAVTLTALAWIVYLAMGIILSPIIADE